MKHIDILFNVLTLLSGIMTALLGFLLYLKYRIKEIRLIFRQTDISIWIIKLQFSHKLTNIYICEDHQPLYLFQDFYESTDLEGIFHYPVKLSQINDDRLGGFLDAFYEAGPRKIFSTIAANAFTTYGITVKNINYDTTSKVMWGTYETDEGREGAISIDFGHSKDKREDKKQLKMAIGTAQGLIVDAKVLSGNKDDKTYNMEKSKQEGVRVYPVEAHAIEKDLHKNKIIMGYGHLTTDEIAEGLARFKRVIPK